MACQFLHEIRIAARLAGDPLRLIAGDLGTEQLPSQQDGFFRGQRFDRHVVAQQARRFVQELEQGA